MATITGVKGTPSIVRRPSGPHDTRGVYLVTANFGAYVGANDDAALAGVGAAITASIRDGKTRTLRSAVCVGAGHDGTRSVYTGACTVSSDALAFNLTDAAGSELANAAATTVPVQFFVTCDE